jgi:alpha-D-ribose 1-methylphosphonate 5-phosphate C-P lyase
MTQAPVRDAAYNFAYLDEQTKRMIRRALLKAVAIPGYQVPFGGRHHQRRVDPPFLRSHGGCRDH